MIFMNFKKTLVFGIAPIIAAQMLLAMRATAEDLSTYNGAQLYRRFCASCHGASGMGDGPVAPSLNVMVPDLTHIARRHSGEFPADLVRRIIDGRTVQIPHGTREMPVWGYEFRKAGEGDSDAGTAADQLVGRVLDYLRTIQKQ
jgi:mono/diheme cytochrome c family protein